MHEKEKEEKKLSQGFQIEGVQQSFFLMLVETPYFGAVINPKTYLNHELGSKLCFLSNLTYKLVNLLVFGKKIR